MAYVLENDVEVTLASGILAGDTSMTVNAAIGIHRNPPDPAGGTGVLVLVDNLGAATKREVVTYTGWTDNQDGTYTLSGISRGQEGTSAQDWGAGTTVFQGFSRGMFEAVAGREYNGDPNGNVAAYTTLEKCWDTSTSPSVLYIATAADGTTSGTTWTPAADLIPYKDQSTGTRYRAVVVDGYLATEEL